MLQLLQLGEEDPELIMTIAAPRFAIGDGDCGYRRCLDELVRLLLSMLMLLVMYELRQTDDNEK